MTYEEKNGIPAPGWSERLEHPDIVAGLKKRRKRAIGCGIVFIALAFLTPIAISLFVKDSITMGEAFKYGGVIAGVLLVCTALTALANACKKPFEGEVTDKKEELRRSKSDKKGEVSYTKEYVTYVKLSSGRTKKIVETTARDASAWKYLKVGDRFRFHPKLAFPYELYDKSKAEKLFCPVCGKENPVEADRCKKCHAPLVK